MFGVPTYVRASHDFRGQPGKIHVLGPDGRSCGTPWLYDHELEVVQGPVDPDQMCGSCAKGNHGGEPVQLP